MRHLKQTAVVVHWIAVYTALISSLYDTHFLSIQNSIPVQTALNSSLYSTQFFSIQRSIPLYWTLSSMSTQHSILLYTALNSSLYKLSSSLYNTEFFLLNTQSLSIQHSISVYYLLTPWSRVLLEKLTGSVASQNIPRNLWNPKVSSQFSLKPCAGAFRSHEAIIQYVREGNPGTLKTLSRNK